MLILVNDQLDLLTQVVAFTTRNNLPLQYFEILLVKNNDCFCIVMIRRIGARASQSQKQMSWPVPKIEGQRLDLG